MGSRIVTLRVNEEPIEIDYFVQGYLDHVVTGILAALQGTGTVKEAEVSVHKDSVDITLNGSKIPLNEFVNTIVRNTLVGMVSSLKDVTVVYKLELHITH
jgi:hypothetical protein